MTEYSDLVLDIVNNSTGIKGIDLALKVMSRIRVPTNFDPFVFANTLTELVQRNKIAEINFMLPTMRYRVKSIYFPEGTKFEKVNEENIIQDRNHEKIERL